MYDNTLPVVHVRSEEGILRVLNPGELQAMKTSELFHRLWTRAVGAPGYVKTMWQALEREQAPLTFNRLRNVAREQPDYADVEWAELEARIRTAR